MNATSSLIKLTVQLIFCAAAILCFAPVDPNNQLPPQAPDVPVIARYEHPLQYAVPDPREFPACAVCASPNVPSADPVIDPPVFSHPDQPRIEPSLYQKKEV